MLTFFGRSCSLQQTPLEKSLKKFKLELWEALKNNFCSRKTKHSEMTATSWEVGHYIVQNYVGEHSLVKWAGRKRHCPDCKEIGVTTASGKPKETPYVCTKTSDNLCQPCFYRRHDAIINQDAVGCKY